MFTGAGLRLPSRTRWRNWPQMAAGSGEPTSDHSERWERRAQSLANRPCRRVRPAATWSPPSAVSSLTGSGTRTMSISAAREGISAEPIAAPVCSIVIVSTPSASSGSCRDTDAASRPRPLRRFLIIMRCGACNQQGSFLLGDFMLPGRLRPVASPPSPPVMIMPLISAGRRLGVGRPEVPGCLR